MGIYIVSTTYLYNGVFGIYSSLKRARIALEYFLANDKDVKSIENLGYYRYQFTTKSGKIFKAEISFDILDAEFVEGICKED